MFWTSLMKDRFDFAYCGDMVHVWLINHGAHGMLNRAVRELIICMLIPDSLKIEIRPANKRLEKCQISGVRQRL